MGGGGDGQSGGGGGVKWAAGNSTVEVSSDHRTGPVLPSLDGAAN